MTVIYFKEPREYGPDSPEYRETRRLKALVEGGADVTSSDCEASVGIRTLRDHLAEGSTNLRVREAIRRLDQALAAQPDASEIARFLEKAARALANAGDAFETSLSPFDE